MPVRARSKLTRCAIRARRPQLEEGQPKDFPCRSCQCPTKFLTTDTNPFAWSGKETQARHTKSFSARLKTSLELHPLYRGPNPREEVSTFAFPIQRRYPFLGGTFQVERENGGSLLFGITSIQRTIPRRTMTPSTNALECNDESGGVLL